MLPKPWIIEEENEERTRDPRRPRPSSRHPLMDIQEAEPSDEERGVAILDISPQNPMEIAI